MSALQFSREVIFFQFNSGFCVLSSELIILKRTGQLHIALHYQEWCYGQFLEWKIYKGL